MKIEESDFIMENEEGPLWDLSLLHIVRPKGKPEREEFQISGYGMPLEKCLQRIVNYRLEKKKETYSLKEYIKAYKEEVDQIKTLFKNM